MTMSVETADGAVRESLVFTLRLGDAHQTFDDAVADFPMDAINVRPPNVDYTFWHLIEHVRFCQNDMLEYLLGPVYEPVTFPDAYWLATSAVASEQQWHDTLAAYRWELGILRQVMGLWAPERIDHFTADASVTQNAPPETGS